MTRIESITSQTGFAPQAVFDFLADLNNHRHFMPSSVTDWVSQSDEAKLKIQGLGSLFLKKGESRPPAYLKIIPAGPAPVDLFLEWTIEPEGTGSKVRVDISADLNMVMKMVAVKPLQGLADYMSSHLDRAMNRPA